MHLFQARKCANGYVYNDSDMVVRSAVYAGENETGFCYLQSRYYDPEVRRFISADNLIASVGTSVEGYNLFGYCFNNPMNMCDPSGCWPRWITGAVAVGTAAVAVVAAVASAPAVVVAAGTISIVYSAGYALQTWHYDARKEKNINVPKTYDEAIKKEGADTTISAACHQFSAVTGPNRKVCWSDGTEGIYDVSGNIVNDPRDIGTYNFSVPNNTTSTFWHAVVDVAPWIVFGNFDDDTTLMFQRVTCMLEGNS